MPILTVKEVIKHLEKYNENQELLITWWDSDFIDKKFECGEHLDEVMDAGDTFIEKQVIGYVNDWMEHSSDYLKSREEEANG